MIEDPWQRVTPYEQSDLLSSLSQMQMAVTRIYTLSIPRSQIDISKHIIVKSGYGTSAVTWQLNDDLFVDLDSAIHLASTYGIRIVFPFIDNWDWWGGVDAFSAM